MNREGAETYLRLLAEAALGRPPRPDPRWPSGGRTRVTAVAQALAAVGALEGGTVEDIVADFDLADSLRGRTDEPGPGAYATAGSRPFAAGRWPAGGPARFRLTGRMTAGGRAVPRPAPEPPDDGPDAEAGRFVPVGLTVPFYGEDASGGLCLMSFARTGSGARFIAIWMRTESVQLQACVRHPDLIPFELFTVTDDRGARYDLDFVPGGGPECASEVSLRPAPPPGVRWLDVAAPLGPAVRVELDHGHPDVPEVSEITLSPGEHLLIKLAERLLTLADQWRHPGRPLAATSLGHHAWVAGLGDIVAALEAAEVLPPLSPVPARLAALCASLAIDWHGIAVPPAHDLPEPWLSLLAHYQRRKPDAAPARDGFAATAATLPEIDGIKLALLGLHNSEGRSSLHLLAQGLAPEDHTGPGPFGADMDFPLSVWLRDSGGRWHAARRGGWRGAGREFTVRLQLMPPLLPSTAWIEVLASGRSAEVRTRLPVRWQYPP